jgi:hypothetical protein
MGDGRYAVGVFDDAGVVRIVYLAMTEQQQRNISLGVEHSRCVNLLPTTPALTTCSTRYDGDADDRRRDREERRSKCD